MVKRKRIGIASLVALALTCAMGLIGLVAPIAWAGDDTVRITDLQLFPGSRNSYRMDSTEGIVYCAHTEYNGPPVDTIYTNGTETDNRLLDYVMYHGYDGDDNLSLSGYTGIRAAVVTQLAVWTVRGKGVGNNPDRIRGVYSADIVAACDNLIADANRWVAAGASGPERGCSKIWSTSAGRYQDIISKTSEVEVSFSKTSADAKVTDGNNSYGYAGAVYDIHLASDGTKVASITTDASGRASCQLLPNTSYYAIEIQAPPGFVKSEERISFTTGTASSAVVLSDKPGTVKIRLMKRDSATKGPEQRGASLEGAEFRCESLSTPGWSSTGTTNEDGELTFSGIPLGTCRITETKAPEGYRPLEQPIEYTVGAGELGSNSFVALIPQEDFLEHPIAADLEISKFNKIEFQGSVIEQPAQGVRFDIISNTTKKVVGTIETGADGHASTSGLWFGDGERNEHINGALPYDRAGYTVSEVASTVPEGFERIDDWTISAEQLADGATLRYIVNNSILSTRIQLIKTDEETGSTIPLPGFVFQLLDEDKNPVSQQVWYPRPETLDRFSTDSDGMVMLPQPLHPGTYYIRELQSQVPYLKRTEDVRFSVSGNEEEIEPVTMVKIPNKQAMGRASIKKSCSEGKEDTGLPGAEFDVIALEDVVSPDGTVHASKDEVVDHVKTDDSGIARTKALHLGAGTARYAFVETRAPSGHVLDPTPVAFTLTYQNQDTEVVSTSVEQRDDPNELIIDKRVLGSETSLPGATFLLWNDDDAIDLIPRNGYGAVGIRWVEDDTAPEQSAEPLLRQHHSTSTVSLELPDGWRALLVGEDGSETVMALETSVKPGSYHLRVTDGTEEVDVDRHESIAIEVGMRYDLKIFNGILGTSVHLDSQPLTDDIPLRYDGDARAYASDAVAPGTYDLVRGNSRIGALTVMAGKRAFATVDEDGKLNIEAILLKKDAKSWAVVTRDDGTAAIDHVPSGSYTLKELSAPNGYLVDETERSIQVAIDGTIEGDSSHSILVEDDYTKVEISKRDIANEEEVVGAHLKVVDAHGKLIDSWISDGAPHRIEALAPGTYTLIEEMTPTTYDQAQEVTFTVRETGEVQSVTMHDAPIEVSGEIDKRQEVADPVADDTQPGTDNRANVSISETGDYEYSIDFRNTSSTWVDEFTVEDELAGVSAGLARLKSIVTPRASMDFDGKLNVWYKTDRSFGIDESSRANATLDDGHVNPWLSHASTAEALGDDGRRIDYAGWKLWRAGIDAAVSQELRVSDLDLGDDEKVVGIRFEFGRVEEGFTSRPDSWDREGLKHAHDDLDDILASHGGSFDSASGTTSYAPAIIRMQVTDSFVGGQTLENRATVKLYRNGGGHRLEDDDRDAVNQSPVSPSYGLPKTGGPGTIAISALATIASCVAWFLAHRNRRTRPRQRN